MQPARLTQDLRTCDALHVVIQFTRCCLVCSAINVIDFCLRSDLTNIPYMV